MIIYKITPTVDYNQWLKRLNTQLIEATNQNSLKPPKLLSQRRRKRYYKTLGTLGTCVYLGVHEFKSHHGAQPRSGRQLINIRFKVDRQQDRQIVRQQGDWDEEREKFKMVLVHPPKRFEESKQNEKERELMKQGMFLSFSKIKNCKIIKSFH